LDAFETGTGEREGGWVGGRGGGEERERGRGRGRGRERERVAGGRGRGRGRGREREQEAGCVFVWSLVVRVGPTRAISYGPDYRGCFSGAGTAADLRCAALVAECGGVDALVRALRAHGNDTAAEDDNINGAEQARAPAEPREREREREERERERPRTRPRRGPLP
jgi:hypothetical protein